MGSIYQCPGCGEIGDGVDMNPMPCACERENDERIAVLLTPGQRAAAILALTKEYGGDVDISNAMIVETIRALLGPLEAK